jgi:hypothetical protein
MQNIDTLYFLQPVITILFSLSLVIYCHFKRSFTKATLAYSCLAYAGAIATKIVLQVVTFSAFQARFGDNAVALGAYFGVQTVFFEVGGAFLVATWAVSRGKFYAKDAEGYGLGLALWENAGYLGVLGLVYLVWIYLTLASGGPTTYEFYSSLVRTRPDLFFPPFQALPWIAWGLLERVTSLLFHFSWGYLCLLAAYFRKRVYLLLALPMGLVDFLVPFAGSLTIPVFESLLFVLGLGILGLTILVTRGFRRKNPSGQT